MTDTAEMLCSWHTSPRRRAAEALEALPLDPLRASRAQAAAAGLLGRDVMVVIVRDRNGTTSWQLLPRVA